LKSSAARRRASLHFDKLSTSDGLSTRLKILSRITEPTEGYAEIHGRVGSLLEASS